MLTLYDLLSLGVVFIGLCYMTRLCVAYMDSAWRLLQLIGPSSIVVSNSIYKKMNLQYC